MAIWAVPNPSADQVDALRENTLAANLGIRFTEIGNDYLVATMPVDHRTIQPRGILHGGASAALVETIASVGGALVAGTDVVGIEINANHIRQASTGLVIGKGSLLHTGKTTQVWEVKITNESNQLICVGRVTLMRLPKPS